MPMKTRAVQNTEAETRIGLEEATCVHRRLIDDILTESGKPTGQVRCLECQTIFDDPYKGFK